MTGSGAESLTRAIVASATDYAIITTDLDGKITSWSEGAHNILGWEGAEVLGTDLAVIFTPEDNDAGVSKAEQAEALASGRAADERWHVRKDQSRFWASGEVMPLRDQEVIGFLKVLRDRTQEHEARHALHRSETLKSAVLEAALDGIITIDASSRVVEWNSAAESIFGYARRDALGQDLAELIVPPDLRAAHREGMARYQTSGHGPLLGRRVEVEAIRADRARFPVELAISPITVDGQTHFTARLRDISERHRSEAALRESEARFRHLADSAPAFIWLTDERGHLTFANMHFDHVFGRPTASLIPDGWRELVHPDDLAAYINSFVGAFEQRGPFRMEVRVFDKSGKTRWLRTEGVPRLDDAGAFLGYTGVGLDLTETKIAQEQQGLLINELNHRVKNTLATVQSLVTRTLRGAASPTQARLDIDARLIALARAHDVLTRENWDGAGLREVVRQAIDPFETDRAGRFDVSGPEIRMSPRLSLSLAMILQELATNAVKYGALSNDCGRVQIDWSVIEGEGLSTLRFFWSEKGGPRVQAPQRRGFGTTLIERTFGYEEGGRADLKYLPDGLVAEISVPV